MKKLGIGLFFFSVLLGLAGCQNNQQNTNSTSTTTEKNSSASSAISTSNSSESSVDTKNLSDNQVKGWVASILEKEFKTEVRVSFPYILTVTENQNGLAKVNVTHEEIAGDVVALFEVNSAGYLTEWQGDIPNTFRIVSKKYLDTSLVSKLDKLSSPYTSAGKTEATTSSSEESVVDTKNLTTVQVNDWVFRHFAQDNPTVAQKDFSQADYLFDASSDENGLLVIFVRENHDSQKMQEAGAAAGHNPTVARYRINSAGELEKEGDDYETYTVVAKKFNE